MRFRIEIASFCEEGGDKDEILGIMFLICHVVVATLQPLSPLNAEGVRSR